MAHTIKTETKVGGNTADRVGSAFEGVADALEGTEQIAEMDKAVQEVQQKVEASKAQIQSLVNALPVVQQTGDSTTSVMSQKAVTDAIQEETDRATAAEQAIIYDVSSHNNGAVFESLQALLSSSNLSTLIPTSVRCGGMSIRFIQGSVPNSNNKYVQWRYMGTDDATFTNIANWKSVEEIAKLIATIEDKTSEIIKKVIKTEDDYICIEDNNGNEVFHLDDNGLDAKNVKSNGKDVLTEHQDISSKADVAYVDNLFKHASVIAPVSASAMPIRKAIESSCNYWIENSKAPIYYDNRSFLDRKIDNVPYGKHFIFVTDSHWNNNSKKSNLLMDYVKTRLSIKKGIFGGDAVNAHSSKYSAANELSSYIDEFVSVFGQDSIICQGNHDGNWVGHTVHPDLNPYDVLIDDSELYKRTIAKCDSKICFDEVALSLVDKLPYSNADKEEIRCFLKYSYYVDDPDEKIRYIVLDTGVGSATQYRTLHSGYGSSIPLYYKSAIRFLSSVPSGYDVVIAGHMLVYYNLAFSPIISAFKAGVGNVNMERSWEWKSVLGTDIYQCELDRDALASKTNGSEVFVKDDYKFYSLYRYDNGWVKTGQLNAHFKSTEAELLASYQSPTVGQYTYVGESGTYVRYECTVEGTWTKTSDTVNNLEIKYGNTSILINTILGVDDSNILAFQTGFSKPFENRLFTLSGHWHFDSASYCMSRSDVTTSVNANEYDGAVDYSTNPVLTNDAFLNIVCDCDARNSSTDTEFKGISCKGYVKTDGTITESSFNVITLTDDNKVVVTNFGSGADRIFNL